MQPEPNANADPVTEDSASPAPEPVAEPTPQPSELRPYSLSRALAEPDRPAAVLNADGRESSEDAASGESGESSATAESKPDAVPTPGEAKPSRRQTAAEANAQRIAELEAENERIRAQARADVLAEQQAEADRAAQAAMSDQERADAERYQRLLATPDADLSNDDYIWRENRKAMLAQFPQAEAHYRAEARRTIAEFEAGLAERQGAFTADLLSQLNETASLPHVDPKPWSEPGTSWARMGRDLHAAGAAWKEAELGPQIAERDEKIARLEEQIKDLRLVGPRGIGSARTPVEGGRSGAAPAGAGTTFDESRHWRRNLTDALA